MPRTLNATLEAALDSGSFQPYFLLTVREVGFSILETAQPFQFKLSGINLEAKWVRQQGSVYEGFNYPHELEFMVTRGVTVAGVNYTIDSSYYYGLTQVWDGTFQTVTACMFKAQKYTAAADVTYKTLIDALCTAQGKTAVYYTVGAAWQSYKFLGSGKVLNLNRAYDVLNMLKQKYLIHACDNGSDQILFKAVGTDADGSADHTLAIGLFKELGYDTAAYRRFLYRDEAATIHYDGNANDPLWNLGYLESTASPPVSNVSFPFRLKPIAPHLKYLSFDQFAFTFGNYPNSLYTNDSRNLQVTEEFNTEFKELAWRILLNTYDWSKGTEGGALPGTIEAAAPFTPLNTTNFDGILTTNDNNIQAAMETIDDHATGHFLDSEGTPANLSGSSNQDGTSTYAARRDHAHQGYNDSEGDPAPIGTAADGTSAYAARRDHVHAITALPSRLYLPFGIYVNTIPISPASSPGYPYAATVERTYNFVKWAQGVYVDTTNNGSNYWTIELIRWTDNTSFASVNTSAGAVNTHLLLTTTTFSPTSVATSGVGLIVKVTKTGTPGNLFIIGPILEISV